MREAKTKITVIGTEGKSWYILVPEDLRNDSQYPQDIKPNKNLIIRIVENKLEIESEGEKEGEVDG